MSSRTEKRFQDLRNSGRKALIPFMTAGDPDPGLTVPLMHTMVDAGASLIELGVPFSDPMADGPVIQAASERAISKGTSLTRVLEMVAEFRERDDQTPVILMGYLNPLIRFGTERLGPVAAAAGVDGFLLVDCPPEEERELQASLLSQGMDCIRLVAPTTTPERLEYLCGQASGFIYYVSFKGITGANRLDTAALAEPIARIRAHSGLPVAAGFGITDAASACATAEFADAIVIGSALVKLMAAAETPEEVLDQASGFVASVRESLDNSQS